MASASQYRDEGIPPSKHLLQAGPSAVDDTSGVPTPVRGSDAHQERLERFRLGDEYRVATLRLVC